MTNYPDQSKHQPATKSFTVTFAAKSPVSQVAVSGVVAASPERAISVAREALLASARQTPTVS